MGGEGGSKKNGGLSRVWLKWSLVETVSSRAFAIHRSIKTNGQQGQGGILDERGKIKIESDVGGEIQRMRMGMDDPRQKTWRIGDGALLR